MFRRLRENKRFRVLYLIVVVLFFVVFELGVFSNPDFNIHDFCMGLTTELIGLVLGVTVIDMYITEKKK